MTVSRLAEGVDGFAGPGEPLLPGQGLVQLGILGGQAPDLLPQLQVGPAHPQEGQLLPGNLGLAPADAGQAIGVEQENAGRDQSGHHQHGPQGAGFQEPGRGHDVLQRLSQGPNGSRPA